MLTFDRQIATPEGTRLLHPPSQNVPFGGESRWICQDDSKLNFSGPLRTVSGWRSFLPISGFVSVAFIFFKQKILLHNWRNGFICKVWARE